MPSVTPEPIEALLASLLSALSHDSRASINGISVWTHILERVSDPTAVRAVDGIRRSVAHQTELAQEVSDIGRDAFALPGEHPAELHDLLHSLAQEIDALRIRLRVPEAPLHVAMGGNALRALLRLVLCDAVAVLTDRGHVDVSVGEAGGRALRIDVAIREQEFAPVEVHVRRPLRQTLALLVARVHDVELDISPGHRVLTVLRSPL